MTFAHTQSKMFTIVGISFKKISSGLPPRFFFVYEVKVAEDAVQDKRYGEH